ncbi:hypothetical protein HHI36_010634 [Cryptolaemus montrouzieri]|uniref:Uncharacterized protein n=1 Tax=Cryptolaemus montrouzieri TaxID=559131 RepID=A0ABD2MJF7_9CUCU
MAEKEELKKGDLTDELEETSNQLKSERTRCKRLGNQSLENERILSERLSTCIEENTTLKKEVQKQKTQTIEKPSQTEEIVRLKSELESLIAKIEEHEKIKANMLTSIGALSAENSFYREKADNLQLSEMKQQEENTCTKPKNKRPRTPRKLSTEEKDQIESRKQVLNTPKTYAQIAARNKRTNDALRQRQECKNHTNEESGEQGDEPKRTTQPSSDPGQEELEEGIVQGHQLSENLILENMSCEPLKKDWQRPRGKKRPAIYGTAAIAGIGNLRAFVQTAICNSRRWLWITEKRIYWNT